MPQVKSSAVQTAPGLRAPDADAFRELIAHMRDGVVVVDRRGIVLLANHAAQRMLRPLGVGLVGEELERFTAVTDRAEIDIAETGMVAELRVSSLVWNGRPVQLITLHDVTDRRKAAREQERRVAMLTEAERVAGLGAWECDLSDRQVAASPGLVKILGATERDYPASLDNLVEAIHPDDRERCDQALHAVLTEGRQASVEHRFMCGDGEIRTLKSIIEPIPGRGGRPTRLLGIVQDVTEERRAEKSRRETVRLLEAIADNTPARISVKDPEGHFIFANLRHQQTVGHSGEQLATMTNYDVLPRDLADELAADDARVLTDGAAITYERTTEAADGTVMTWLSVKFPILGDEGYPYAVGLVSVDVTEQRQAISALRASEERFRLLAERSKDMIFLIRLDPIPTVEYVSPAAATVLGRAPQELTGDLEKLLDLLSHRGLEITPETLRSPNSRPHVYRHVRPDGSVCWIEQQTIAIRDSAGAVIAMEGTLRDVTDRVIAEQERHKVTRQLEQTERMESLGQLAGGIAHDFNNLLAVILGTAQLMVDDLGSDDPRSSDLQRIVRTAERGADLTRQLLIFSRRAPSHIEVIDLNEIVTGIEDMVNRTIGEDIDFGCLLEPALAPVEIDRARIEQVLINLVVNARAAMPEGGSLCINTAGVRIPEDGAPQSTGGSVPPGDYVVLTVTDSGSGMAPEVAGHVFEPFFTTRGPGKGTGLGLATVHGILKQAGGHITLDTRPGLGTAFQIFLPAASGRVAQGVATTVAAPQGRGEMVLLVEDEEPVRDVVSRILTRNNYRVLSAADPEEALRICAEPGVAIDALLTDIVMPGMSGSRLAERLHATTRPGLPVLFMSGYPGAGDRRTDHGRPPPDATVLRKPFDAEVLLRELRRTLETVSARAPDRQSATSEAPT